MQASHSTAPTSKASAFLTTNFDSGTPGCLASLCGFLSSKEAATNNNEATKNKMEIGDMSNRYKNRSDHVAGVLNIKKRDLNSKLRKASNSSVYHQKIS